MEEFGNTETPDQVSYKDDGLDTQELNEVIQDLWSWGAKYPNTKYKYHKY